MNQSGGSKRAIERVITPSNLDKSPEDHKTLDQLRQRVETLTRSLESLNNSFFRQSQLPGPGLPSWPDINATIRTINLSLAKTQALLDGEPMLLNAMHVHPNATFPWHHDHMNEQLLRKRLNPEMETWVEKRRKTGRALATPPSATGPTSTTASGEDVLTTQDWEELWTFGAPENQFILKQIFPDLFPDYDESEDEEEEGRGVLDAEVEMPKVSLEDVLRFATTGIMPPRQGLPGDTGAWQVR